MISETYHYTSLNTRRRRLQNALLGLFMGDALAMPAHWFYNVDNIAKVFNGGIHGYVDPPHPHLESFMMWNFHTMLSDIAFSGKGI